MKPSLSPIPNLSFRARIVLLGVFSVLCTVVALLAGVAWQSQHYSQDAQNKVNELTNTNLSNINQGIYNLLEAQGESVQQQVDSNLKVARYVWAHGGMLRFSKETVSWKAVNQFTQATTEIELPKMYMGGRWVGQNTDPNVETPVIDEIIGLVGGTATLFQRINPDGDMLRVATNVANQQGQRAIGTYIPAVNPDGAANPVIETVLKGETYRGVAFVVNAWYITAYEPVRDELGDIVGMLYVGVRQEQIEALRTAIHEARVGQSGYVYVLSGSGDNRGRYIVSPKGDQNGGSRLQDGESALTIRDVDGHAPVEDILAAAQTLGVDETQMLRYQEPARDGAAPRWKLVYVSYYQPWDWVIVSEVYEDELLVYERALQQGRTDMLVDSSLTGLAIALIVGIVSYFATFKLIRPLVQLADTAVQIAAGNMDLQAPVNSKDELGQLAVSFNHMTARLRERLIKEQRQHQYLQNTVRRYVEHMDRVAHGNLAERVAVELSDMEMDDSLLHLGQRLNQMTESLQDMIQQIGEAVSDLNTVSTDILSVTVQQASSTSEQSAAVAETVTTVDQVRSIVEQNSQRSKEVADAAQHTLQVSQQGKQAVQDTIGSMSHIKERVNHLSESIMMLSEQTRQIGEIINSVNEIAAQSNMLALNASVEAARAGESGRGFQMVALEVRRLAEQSRKATNQIRNILSDVQEAIESTVAATEEGTKGVENGVKLAAQSGESIERLAVAVNQSAQFAVQIVVGGKQQQTGIEQIALAMQHINEAAAQAQIGTRQAEMSAQNLNLLARKLAETVAEYRL